MEDKKIIVRKRENPFVQIDNSIFIDNRISFKAKGILGYLLSKPDNWTVRVKDLYNHTTEGYMSIRSGMEELILAGYMELRTKYSLSGEEFTGRRLEVYEQPLFPKGWRMKENKNKNFTADEPLVDVNPNSNKREFYK